jgi:predicted SAM-dependent methyltransferase
LPDASVDIIIANHVLEHVDDGRALAEIFRVLRSCGELVCMVPLVEGWCETYENPAITSPTDRERHFGRYDHVRYYGSDFRQRVRAAGFALREITATPDDVIDHRLTRGEKVFVGLKPA